MDVGFPSFSAEVIDKVNVGVGWNIIYVDDFKYRNITITDPSSIAVLESCFDNPIQTDDTKVAAFSALNFAAESDQFRGIYYELGFYVYDGRYCLRQSDGISYEIPEALLEQVTGLNFYSPADYQTIDKFKREWRDQKWKSTSDGIPS